MTNFYMNPTKIRSQINSSRGAPNSQCLDKQYRSVMYVQTGAPGFCFLMLNFAGSRIAFLFDNEMFVKCLFYFSILLLSVCESKALENIIGLIVQAVDRCVYMQDFCFFVEFSGYVIGLESCYPFRPSFGTLKIEGSRRCNRV